MRTLRCLFCSRPFEHWHHVTGRPHPDTAYFDPKLVVPLCKKHHAREHVVLVDKGLEWLADDDDPIAHRVGRMLLLIERCADFRRPFSLEASAAMAFVRLVRELVEERCALSLMEQFA